jgi:hypothetical protein
MKPIIRWTIGNVGPLGLRTLFTSISSITKIYKNRFRFFLCHNNIPNYKLRIIKDFLLGTTVELYEQKWSECCIPDKVGSIYDDYGNIIFNNGICGGSLWKVSPARLDLNVHEIILDNDLVLFDHLPKIDEFLSSSKNLCLEDPITFQGKYHNLFKKGEAYNSGLIGLPPQYDFEKEVFNFWNKNKIFNLSHGDEQGLLTKVLTKDKNYILIKKTEIVELHNGMFCVPYKDVAHKSFPEIVLRSGNKVVLSKWTDYRNVDLKLIMKKCYGFHFVESNRSKYNSHIGWKEYIAMNTSVAAIWCPPMTDKWLRYVHGDDTLAGKVLMI